MTPEELSAIAGVLLSLAFSYVPRFRDWYGNLEPDYKRLIMVGLLLVVSAVAYFYTYGLEYVPAAALEYLKVFLASLIANQAAFTASPQVYARKELAGG